MVYDVFFSPLCGVYFFKKVCFIIDIVCPVKKNGSVANKT